MICQEKSPRLQLILAISLPLFTSCFGATANRNHGFSTYVLLPFFSDPQEIFMAKYGNLVEVAPTNIHVDVPGSMVHIEKATLKPEFFEDLHLPLTLSGGPLMVQSRCPLVQMKFCHVLRLPICKFDGWAYEQKQS